MRTSEGVSTDCSDDEPLEAESGVEEMHDQLYALQTAYAHDHICDSPHDSGLSTLPSASEFLESGEDSISEEPVGSAHEMQSFRKRHRWCVVALVIALVLATVLPVLVIVLPRSSDTTPSKTEPSMGETSDAASASAIAINLRKLLQSYSDSFDISPQSPQSRAVTWLSHPAQDPTLGLGRFLEDDSLVTRILHRYALIVLAFSCGGDSWRGLLLSWKDQMESHECEWTGLTCNDDGQVEQLHLELFEMTGQLPNEIGYLTDLTHLNVGENRLQGTVPISIYENLSNLENLELQYNEFSSTIPSDIGNLSLLRSMNYAFNPIGGPLPQELRLLSNLIKFDSHNTNLSGDIIDLASAWPQIQILAVGFSNATVSNTSASDFALLKNLHTLSIEGLPIKEIPSEFGTMSNLKILHCGASNILTGPIPTELGLCPSLEVLHVQGTSARGNIPSELGKLSLLRGLVLANNLLSGTVPLELTHADKLRFLIFSSNRLTGPLPSEIGALTDLSYLFIDANEESIVVPDEICSPQVDVRWNCYQTCHCCDRCDYK